MFGAAEVVPYVLSIPDQLRFTKVPALSDELVAPGIGRQGRRPRSSPYDRYRQVLGLWSRMSSMHPSGDISVSELIGLRKRRSILPI